MAKQNLIDFVSVAYIVYKNTVLLVHHKQLNRWLPIGGHVRQNENPEQALFNKIRQETGLSKDEIIILSAKPQYQSEEQKYLYTPSLLDIHKISDTHKHVGIIYFVRSKTRNIRISKEAHNNFAWLSRKDLHNPKYSLRTDMIYAAEKAIETAEQKFPH